MMTIYPVTFVITFVNKKYGVDDRGKLRTV